MPDCKYPVVALITEWRDENGNVEVRSERAISAGSCVSAHSSASWLTIAWFASCTMRRQLLSVIVTVTKSTTCLLKQIEDAGLRVAGRSGDDQLVEIIEVPNHPWFVACQFHPEFTSTPRDGHPLFAGFVKAASELQKRQAK